MDGCEEGAAAAATAGTLTFSDLHVEQEVCESASVLRQTDECRRGADRSGGGAQTSLSAGEEQGDIVDLTSALPLGGSCSTASDGPEVSVAAAPTTPVLAALTPKRSYKCRQLQCTVVLSSASNRSRHEKSKHPQQSLAAAATVRTLELPPPSSGFHGSATTVSTSMQQETIHRRSSKRAPPASLFAAAALNDDEYEGKYDGGEEEEDIELQRFAASAAAAAPIVARAAAGPSLFEDHLSSTPTSEDGDAVVGERKDDTHVSSGGEHSPGDDSSSTSEGSVQGMPVLFSDEALQEGCLSFMQWLTCPPLTHAEALVKKRGRITSLSQLQPIKCNLRFLMTLAVQHGLTDKVDLQIFTRLDVCQALFTALGERRVGAGRFHALFLLAKKILISLACQESTRRRQYYPPSLFDSFLFVDGVCSESGQKRKIDARNRALLGLQATRQLLGEQSRSHPPQPFRIPATWSSASGSSSPASADSRPSPTLSARGQPARAASAAAAAEPPSSEALSCNELSKQELQVVTRYCLDQLREYMHAHHPIAVRLRFFQALVVTATLCLGLAPRSQVLRSLKIGSSFTKHADDGRYWVKLAGQMTKSQSKPILFALPSELTPVYDFYLDTVRPQLLAPASEDQRATHDYLFVKRDGSPRVEFSRSCTHPVTLAALSRAVNCHAFRGAVVVTFYEETQATQTQMNVLADIMGHSPAVAKAFYYRPQFSKAAVHTNDMMTNILLRADA